MQSISLSVTRISRIAISTSAALAAILATVYFYHPAQHLVHELTKPVTVRPPISGSVIFYGRPIAGVELRIGGKTGNSWQPCANLPVVAVSDKDGKFKVPARTKPHFMVGRSKFIPAEVCVTRGTEQLAGWLSFFTLNNTLAKVIRCQRPIIGPVGPENDTCYISAP